MGLFLICRGNIKLFYIEDAKITRKEYKALDKLPQAIIFNSSVFQERENHLNKKKNPVILHPGICYSSDMRVPQLPVDRKLLGQKSADTYFFTIHHLPTLHSIV